MLKLYGYFRSSAAYRVRIALNLKGMEYEQAPVHLLKDGGEQKKPDYLEKNPQGLVPTLVDGDFVLGQSMAIMDYLDDKQPEPPLVFGDAQQKARIRQLAQIIACEIHPLNNLRVLQHIQSELGASDEQKMDWYGHWGLGGLEAFEKLLEQDGRSGPYCMGDQISLADICLVPQLYNMRRFNFDLSAFPRILEIEKNCLQHPAFQKAVPEMQPDTPDELRPAPKQKMGGPTA